MLARFNARLLLLCCSAPAWVPGVVLVLGVAGSSTDKGRAEAPRGFSALVGGGEGDLDLEIQERLAKSAKDSGLDRSGGFPAAGVVSVAEAATCCWASLLGRCSWLVRTLGLDLELGSHERGRSTIDLLLVRA